MTNKFNEQNIWRYGLTARLISNFFLLLVVSLIPIILFAEDWHPIAPQGAPEARQGHSMVTLPDGRVMLFGGEDQEGSLFNDLYAFEDNGWAQVIPNYAPPPPMEGHSANLLPDNNTNNNTVIFIFGGRTADGYSNDIYQYNVDTEEYTKIEPQGTKPPARKHHGACVLDNGRVVVVGGESESDFLKDTWIYDPHTNNWFQGAPTPGSLLGPAIGYLGDYLYVLGQSEDGKIYRYDVSQNQWDIVTLDEPYPMHYRNYSVNTQYGDKVFFGGGSGWDFNIGNDVIHNDFWYFDMSSQSWTQLEDLPLPLYKSSAAAFTGNSVHVVVFGGISENETAIGDMYEYVTESLGAELIEDIPTKFTLKQNYPNPFNPTTTIQFNVVKSVHVKLNVHNLLGREVLTLIDSEYQPGQYSVTFNASQLTAGIYFYRIIMGEYTAVKKMVVLK